jgi:membrane associated rhomboid family serine protease
MERVPLFRTGSRPACDERAFVLHAVGIESEIAWDGEAWVLWTQAADEGAALAQLQRYERENPPRRVARTVEPVHARAWLGSACYAATIVLVAWLGGHHAFAADWLAAGGLDTRAFRSGEVWRAVTAVTLHFDVAHLLGNLGFGMFFGWLAGQLLGPGVAWSGALAAAVAANLLNASVQPASHFSAGASTAVFALLGLLAAYAWRRRAGAGDRWAYRWAPLIAGLFLLGFTGVGGENTDVLAHLTGFATGTLSGWWLGRLQRMPRDRTQWLAGMGALAGISAAWWAAFNLAG